MRDNGLIHWTQITVRCSFDGNALCVGCKMRPGEAEAGSARAQPAKERHTFVRSQKRVAQLVSLVSFPARRTFFPAQG
jgi:hypothetical protein